MAKYILKRILGAIPVLLGVTLLVFLLLRIAPGDAAMIRLQALGIDPSPEVLDQMREPMGLNLPVWKQSIQWISDVARLDFGNSLITGEPVINEFLLKFRATLQLSVPTLVVVILAAIPSGILSAVFQDRFVDNISRAITTIFMSVPPFCLGLLLILVFSVKAGILPSFGTGSVLHLVMPCVTLSAGLTAHYTRFIRSALLDEFSKGYIRSARMRGVNTWRLTVSHAMKNALIPVITSFGMSFGLLLGGSAMVEKIFSWPGVGKFLIDAILRRDYA